MQLQRIDHLVLTVHDIKESCTFYARVLGMEVVDFADNRKALAFGSQKINLHEQGKEFEPRARAATPGSMDICLLCDETVDELTRHLQQHDISIIEGPVQRTGAVGPVTSIYFRDPDGNLLELATPLRSSTPGTPNPEPNMSHAA